MKRGLRTALLAAGSVLAVGMAMGGRAEAAAVCSVQTNPALPYTQAGNTCVTFTATPSGSGAVTNNGTVNATGASNPSATGVSVMTGATVNGDIVNNGAITGNNYGVLVNGGSVTGAITNATSATITANSGDHSEAIYVSGPGASVGSITNKGTLNGGIFLTGAAATGTTIGAVTNNGTINAGIGAGNFGADINVSEVTINGDVSNTGTLVDDSTGAIQVINGGAVNGSVTNSGSITNNFAQGAGIFVFAPYKPDGVDVGPFAGETITGSVSNLSGGAINGGYGIQVFATNSASPVDIKGNVSNAGAITASQSGIEIGSAEVDGSVINTGKISATNGNGIQVIDLTSGTGGAPEIKGGITNSGTISAGQSGISLVNANVGGVTNAKSGTITASNGVGIRVAATGVLVTSSGASVNTGSAGSMVTGDVANAGTITAKTGVAVIQGSTVTGNINNTGSITGSLYGIMVDDSTVTGSIVNGTGATITADTNKLGEAIYVSGPGTSVGAITNNGTLNGGIFLTGAAATGTTIGAVTNNGTINAGIGAGNFGADIAASEVTINGDISNTGTLVDDSTGAIQVINGGAVNGSVTNSGSITNNFAQGAGIFVFAPYKPDGVDVGPFAGETITGSISNQSGGTITGGYGIQVFATNSASPVEIQGNVSNAGTITASQSGIEIGSAKVDGSIMNSGKISATNGDGIQVIDLSSGTGGAPEVKGGITNSGTITAGANGIDVVNANVGGITNAAGATITANGSSASIAASSGAGIRVAATGVLVTSSGVSVNTGSAGSTVTGNITNAGTITGEDGIAVVQGSTVDGDISNTGTITGSTAGIEVYHGTVTGSITNATGATISSPLSTGGGAIFVRQSTVGAITNDGTINGSIAVTGSLHTGTTVGSITNNGAINSGPGPGQSGPDIWVGSTTVNGDIVNNGKMVANATGAIMIVNTGVVNGSVTNNGSITNNYAGGAGIYIWSDPTGPYTGETITGSVSNAQGGAITGSFGIQVFSTKTSEPTDIQGNVSNAGTITASTSGIVVGGAEIDGSIINTGKITATAGSGIEVNAFTSSGVAPAVVKGSITNSGTITTNGTMEAGIYLAGADVEGGVTNAAGATLNASNGAGIYVGDSAASFPTGSAVVSGTITNSGTINAMYGVVVSDSEAGDGIVNTGAINDSAYGIVVVDDGVVFGGVTNAKGGTISGAGTGIVVAASGVVVGGVTNNGTISGKNGIVVSGSTSAVVGGIVNTGTITASEAGILLNGGVVTGPSGANGIVNSGTITGADGIVIAAGGSVGGPIVNTGTITGTTAAIDVTGEGAATTIDQEGGTITGAILLSSMADVVNISGGTIDGNIVGGGANNTVNFNLGSGSFDYKYAFTDVGQANFNSGTVTLEGADTPANVAINGGEVIVGNNGAFGTATVVMASGTTLGFLSNADYDVANNFTLNGGVSFTAPSGTVQTVSGVLSDGGSAGSLNVAGAGVLNLTGANTYSGGTTLSSGTLRVGVDTVGSVGAITSSAVGTGLLTFSGGTLQAGGDYTIDNAGSVNTNNGAIDANGYVFTYAGAIGGAGALAIDNSGSGGGVVFTANNTYSGGTTINGTLQLGDGGTSGSVAGNIVDNGLLVFDRSDSPTYAGVISGTGAVEQAGSGTLVLTGANTYAGGTGISAGTLQIGAGGTSGWITGDVADDGVLAFDRSDDVTFGGAISGTGELEQIGSGTLTLTGTSQVGSTVVAAGTLVVDGALTSTFTIDNGATLEGSSTTLLTSNAITDNGTLVFDQTADGEFNTAIDGSGALEKEGTALLVLNGISSVGSTAVDSGNLQIGNSSNPGAQLTSPTVMVNPNGILSGHGTIVGNVTNNGTVAPGGTIGTLTIQGNYTQTSTGVLQIEITPTTNSVLAVTGTANLAGTVDLLADPGNYRKGETYTFLTAGTINGSFSSIINNAGLDIGPGALTGQAVVLAGIFTPVGSTSNQTAIGQALVNVPVGANTDFDTIANAVLNLSPGPQNAALSELGGEVDADLPTMARDSARSFLNGISEQLHDNGPGSDAAANGDPWGRAYGNFGSVAGNSNAHGFDDTSGGVMLGASHAVSPNAVVGAAFDYEHTDITLDDLPQSGELNIFAGALYGEMNHGPYFVDVAGALGYDSNSTTRHIDFSTISRLADGSFGGFTGSVMGTVGQRVPFGTNMMFEPSASLIYTHVHQDGFDEYDGNGADLAVDGQSQDALESIIKGKVTKTYTLSSGAVLKASLQGGWGHEFDSTYTDITEAFAVPGGTPFTLAGADPGRNVGLFGASLTYDLSQRFSFFGRYDGSYGDLQTNHAVSVGFSMKW
jgi:autotransporter-associated beta strand protein